MDDVAGDDYVAGRWARGHGAPEAPFYRQLGLRSGYPVDVCFFLFAYLICPDCDHWYRTVVSATVCDTIAGYDVGQYHEWCLSGVGPSDRIGLSATDGDRGATGIRTTLA